MTTDGLAEELPTGTVLALCDKVLGEVGRRSHRFAWLRAPGAGADAWLPVEAYYPRHRLVVVCGSDSAPHDHLFGQLVPQHGLRLLQFKPSELGSDPAVAERALRRMIARLPPLSTPEDVGDTRARPAGARAWAQRAPRASRATRAPAAAAVSTQTAPSAEPASASRHPSILLPSLAGTPVRRAARSGAAVSPRHAPALPPEPRPALASNAHTVETVAVGVAAGLALAAVCGAELVVAVIAVALDAGRLVLGLGLAVDACARALGALDSGRVGKTDWAWACAIIGSPAVVAAALLWPRPRRPGRLSAPGEVPTEAAPLAGLMATLALVCMLVGLVT